MENNSTSRAERLPLNLRQELASTLRAGKARILEHWWDSQFNPELLERYQVEAVSEHAPPVLKKKFLAPLFELLLNYLQSGDETTAAFYLDERLRYAPHRRSPEERVSFFREVLARDEQTLLKFSSAGSVPVLKEILRELHAPLLSTFKKPLRVLGIGDFLMNELRARLPKYAALSGLELDFRCFYMHEPMGVKVSAAEQLRYLEQFKPEIVAVSLLTYGSLQLYSMLLKEAERLPFAESEKRVRLLLSQVSDFVAELRSQSDAPFILHNASGLPLTRLRKYFPFLGPLSERRKKVLELINQGVLEISQAVPKVLLFDEHKLAHEAGLRSCVQSAVSRDIGADSFFQHTAFGAVLAAPYTDLLLSYRLLGQAKVLLVDFDNTLWQGVMADGPVVQRYELQRTLRRLKDSGILLVALSKNDPANIRWDEMVLKPDDFVLHKISWNNKVQSARETAEELQLGTDSFVLLDDSPVERALVSAGCPAVKVLDSTLAESAVWLERMLKFPNTRDTEEARARTEMYRKQAERRAALSASFDYPAMMASLDLTARFGPASEADLDRITELCQRTNQFNTTTKRYQKTEIAHFLTDERHKVYAAELSDKFGNVGLVGVVIVERRGPERIIDSFVMSCRAMGFELERLMLTLALYSEGREVSLCRGLFFKTDKNKPASTLFEKCGFEKKGEEEWVLDLSGHPVNPSGDQALSVPGWFTVLSRAGTPLIERSGRPLAVAKPQEAATTVSPHKLPQSQPAQGG